MKNRKKGFYKSLANSRRGFTLIELLVSISIIAILTSLLTANFIGARQRGRDGQRKSNLLQIQSALELYRSNMGIYPTDGTFMECGRSLTDGTVTYMQKVPCEPLSSNPSYSYSTTDTGVTYTLKACLENKGDQDTNIDRTDTTSCPNGVAYVLKSP